MIRKIEINGRILTYDLSRTSTHSIRLIWHAQKDPCLAVHAPRGLRLAYIEEIIRSKYSWIQQQEDKQQTFSGFRLFGRILPVEKQVGNRNEIYFHEGKIIWRITEPFDEERAVAALERFWQKQLSGYIEENRERYETISGQCHVEFRYRHMETRYGSCTPAENRIRLSLYLAQCPTELIDGVVFHEYAHFKQMNHSARFYKVLETYCPDYMLRRKKLREYDFADSHKIVRQIIEKQ